MSEDRMPQEEALEIARQRKVHEGRLHQLMFSTPYGIDALANHLAANGKVTWSAELRRRAGHMRDALERYITKNDERVFLGIAIHKDHAIEMLKKASKDQEARRGLANLLVDLPPLFGDITQADPKEIIQFPQVLPALEHNQTGELLLEGYIHQIRRFHLIYVGIFTQAVALMDPVRNKIRQEANRLQQGHLYLVSRFTDRFALDERREAMSDAGRSLALASHTYDPDLDQRGFVDYVSACIRDAYQERTRNRSPREAQHLLPLVSPTKDEPVLTPEYLMTLSEQGVISPKQIEILRRKYGLENRGVDSDTELLKFLSTTSSDIGRTEARAIKALRKRLPKDLPDETRWYQNGSLVTS